MASSCLTEKSGGKLVLFVIFVAFFCRFLYTNAAEEEKTAGWSAQLPEAQGCRGWCEGRWDGVAGAEGNVAESVGHRRLETEERVVVEEREEADAVSGGARETDGGRSGTLEETGEAAIDDDGRSGTLEETDEEARDDDGSGVQEREEAECGPSNEEAPAASKRRRLSEITAMGDEPLQAWLDSLPREDVQHMALLLYTRLPAIFGLKKTDTAAAVGDILQKNERTIRRWIDDFASNGGEFSDSLH